MDKMGVPAEDMESLKPREKQEMKPVESYKFRRHHALILVILAGIPLTALCFAYQGAVKKSKGSTRHQTLPRLLPTSSGGNFLVAGTQVITSSTDFLSIQPTDSTLKILSLSDNGPEPALKSNSSNITTIEILGPTEPQWIRFLAVNFPEVTNLTLSVDEMCECAVKGSLVEFPNVTTLRLFNLRTCECSRYKWVFPSISVVEVRDSYIHKENFQYMHRFLEKYKDQLTKVSIRSKFCKGCMWHDIEFPKHCDTEFRQRD